MHIFLYNNKFNRAVIIKKADEIGNTHHSVHIHHNNKSLKAK